MKFPYLTVLLLFFGCCSYAQPFEERFNSAAKTEVLTAAQRDEQSSQFDFAKLFTFTRNSSVYGAIGDFHQRLRIKFITVTKDTAVPGVYHVYGKSMVNNTVDEFTGTMKITRIIRLTIARHGCGNEGKYTGYKGEYSLFGEYEFIENKRGEHAGKFKGKFRSDYFVSKNNMPVYNDIEDCADSYINNQFIGSWKGYKSILKKSCNWGDYRVPDSGDLDIGAGEFSPDDKYLQYGWQSLRDYVGQSGPGYKKAEQAEEAQWWK